MNLLTPDQLQKLKQSAVKLPTAKATPTRKVGRPTGNADLYDQLRPVVTNVLQSKAISVIDTTRWLLKQLKVEVQEGSSEWHRWHSFVTRTHRALKRSKPIHSTKPANA